MRELERHIPSPPPPSTPTRLAIVGPGRLGTALAGALRDADPLELQPLGPFGRDAARRPEVGAADAVLLCVPDAEILPVARALASGPLVGHCSGATALDVLAPHERFLMHPLMTVTARGAAFAGAGAAVTGSTPRAIALAQRLARALGMTPVAVDEADRPAYHAAASIASNFLVTLEAMAERLAAGAGVGRDLLVPLVRATVDNWAALGPQGALTGPVARGDELTVARQRAAVAERAPELLDAFDALTAVTRDLARSVSTPATAPAQRPAA